MATKHSLLQTTDRYLRSVFSKAGLLHKIDRQPTDSRVKFLQILHDAGSPM